MRREVVWMLLQPALVIISSCCSGCWGRIVICSLNQLLTLHITVPTSQARCTQGYSSGKPVREAPTLEGNYISYCKPFYCKPHQKPE